MTFFCLFFFRSRNVRSLDEAGTNPFALLYVMSETYGRVCLYHLRSMSDRLSVAGECYPLLDLSGVMREYMGIVDAMRYFCLPFSFHFFFIPLFSSSLPPDAAWVAPKCFTIAWPRLTTRRTSGATSRSSITFNPSGWYMTTVAFAASSATRASGNEKPRPGGRGLPLSPPPSYLRFLFFLYSPGSSRRLK